MARDVSVRMLDERLCRCVMMCRINPPHLLWTLDNLDTGGEVNRILVRREVKNSDGLAMKWVLNPVSRLCNRLRLATTVPELFATD